MQPVPPSSWTNGALTARGTTGPNHVTALRISPRERLCFALPIEATLHMTVPVGVACLDGYCALRPDACTPQRGMDRRQGTGHLMQAKGSNGDRFRVDRRRLRRSPCLTCRLDRPLGKPA